ncbi:MAG: helix-turn-helix domain-containing protein [Eubacteriales bacterium]
MDRTFAVRLTDLRKSTGLSQKEVSAALGVSQALLSHYEKGIRECGLSFITRASEYYGVTCDYLLGQSSLKRGFGEGFFSLGDIPEDYKLDSLTVFRISSVLREKLRNQPPAYGDVFLKYYALSMYRFLVSAINAGDLPRNWISEFAPIENPVYTEMLDGLENILLDRIGKGPQRVLFYDTPLCIKTLVSEMEDFISEQVKGIRYLT